MSLARVDARAVLVGSCCVVLTISALTAVGWKGYSVDAAIGKADFATLVESKCVAGYGFNCTVSQCCKDDGWVCYRKNNHWASCMPRGACVKGINPYDAAHHKTAWSCMEPPWDLDTKQSQQDAHDVKDESLASTSSAADESKSSGLRSQLPTQTPEKGVDASLERTTVQKTSTFHPGKSNLMTTGFKKVGGQIASTTLTPSPEKNGPAGSITSMHSSHAGATAASGGTTLQEVGAVGGGDTQGISNAVTTPVMPTLNQPAAALLTAPTSQGVSTSGIRPVKQTTLIPPKVETTEKQKDATVVDESERITVPSHSLREEAIVPAKTDGQAAIVGMKADQRTTLPDEGLATLGISGAILKTTLSGGYGHETMFTSIQNDDDTTSMLSKTTARDEEEAAAANPSVQSTPQEVATPGISTASQTTSHSSSWMVHESYHENTQTSAEYSAAAAFVGATTQNNDEFAVLRDGATPQDVTTPGISKTGRIVTPPLSTFLQHETTSTSREYHATFAPVGATRQEDKLPDDGQETTPTPKPRKEAAVSAVGATQRAEASEVAASFAGATPEEVGREYHATSAPVGVTRHEQELPEDSQETTPTPNLGKEAAVSVVGATQKEKTSEVGASLAGATPEEVAAFGFSAASKTTMRHILIKTDELETSPTTSQPGMSHETTLLPFHCEAEIASWFQWSSAKKQWCCKHQGRGCLRQTTPPPFNCKVGLTNWQAGWSSAKMKWCCWHEGKGCTRETTSPSFDCKVGLANWQAGWSSAKMKWCCWHEGRGCNPETTTPPIDCDAVLGQASLSSPQRKWCCWREGKGCRSPETAIVEKDAVVTTHFHQVGGKGSIALVAVLMLALSSVAAVRLQSRWPYTRLTANGDLLQSADV